MAGSGLQLEGGLAAGLLLGLVELVALPWHVTMARACIQGAFIRNRSLVTRKGREVKRGEERERAPRSESVAAGVALPSACVHFAITSARVNLAHRCLALCNFTSTFTRPSRIASVFLPSTQQSPRATFPSPQPRYRKWSSPRACSIITRDFLRSSINLQNGRQAPVGVSGHYLSRRPPSALPTSKCEYHQLSSLKRHRKRRRAQDWLFAMHLAWQP